MLLPRVFSNEPLCLSLRTLLGFHNILILNLVWPWRWSEYLEVFEYRGLFGLFYYFHTRVCSQMTSRGDLCHIGTSKLLCKASQWTGSCVMRFLPEVCSEQTMILNGVKVEKYTTVLCFSTRRGSLPYLVLGVWWISWSGLWCPGSSQSWGVFSLWYKWD